METRLANMIGIYRFVPFMGAAIVRCKLLNCANSTRNRFIVTCVRQKYRTEVQG
jgi:hypothetical protein